MKMMTDEEILHKAMLLLEKISENSDLHSEALLREISEPEMKGVEAILQKIAENPRGALAFDDLFGDKARLVIPFPTTDTNSELGQFVDLLTNKLGYNIEWEKGLMSSERKYEDKSIDAHLARISGNLWKADRVKKIQIKIGKFFKKLADLGREYNQLQNKAIEWAQDNGLEHITKPTQLIGDYVEKALDEKELKRYYQIDSQLSWYLGQNVMPSFVTHDTERIDKMGEYWMKNAEYIKENIKNLENDQYSIILTRHPVDVMRMSDFDKITSCHTPPSRGGGSPEYYKCAVAEAQGHGAIAYVVETEELLSQTNAGNIESAAQELEEYDEIFTEQERWMSGTNLGLEPVSRTRLRQFRYFDWEKHDAGEDDGTEVAVPEKSVYGLKIPGLVATVTNWARERQEEVISKMPRRQSDGTIDLDDFKIYGGSYEDTSGFAGRRALLANLIDTNLDDFTGEVRQDKETEDELPSDWIGDLEKKLNDECRPIATDWNQSYARCQVDYFIRDEGENDWVIYPEGKLMLKWELDEWAQLPNVSAGQDIADYLNQNYYNPDAATASLFDDSTGAIYRGGPEGKEVIVFRCEFNNAAVPRMEGQEQVYDSDGFNEFCVGVDTLDDKRDLFKELIEQYAKIQGWFEGHAYLSLAVKIENNEIGSYEWDVDYDGEYYDSYEAWATISYDFDPEDLGVEPRILFDLVDRREFALRLRGFLTAQAREETGAEYWLSIRDKSAVEVGGDIRYSITFKVDADVPDDLVTQFYDLVTGEMDDEDEIAKAFMGALREEAAKNGVKLNGPGPAAEKVRDFDALKDLGEVWRRFI